MDLAEYMPMFLAEAQEHLQGLNLAVIRLEENPRDHETLDEIFRIAHSLKGMSATMGFDGIAKLTHEMENVFELLRERKEGLSKKAIDAVLACLDALTGATESLATSGEEGLDPAELIEQLRGLVRREEAAGAAEAEPDLEPDRSPGNPAAPVGPAWTADRTLEVVVCLGEQVLMPAVRAHMVLTALTEHGTILSSTPQVDAVDDFADRTIQVQLVSASDEAVVHEVAAAITDVTSVEVTVADGAGATDPSPAIQAPADPAPPAAPENTSPAPARSGGTRPATPAGRTVRVDSERLDALMHQMGELVIHRTAIEALTTAVDVPGLHQAMQELTRTSQALQSMVMQVRMIPVEVVFMRFPRLVRDLGGRLGKEVRLDLVGADTELDRTVVDALGDPLVHLVRNSLDHGLESAEERVAAGKPAEGTLTIAARHAGGNVVIEVRDDGAGVNPAAVARKALANGLIDAQRAEEVDMRAACELLFAAGFSTAEQTSDISGRGVGMDAVRAKIRELGGEVLIDSILGQGTSVQIRLPLTLAIVSALQVEVDGDAYAIPLDRIDRTLRLSEQAVRTAAGQPLLVLEHETLPIIDGAEVFGRGNAGEHGFAVVLQGDGRTVALTVDDLVGQRELVTRPLPAVVASAQPVSGGAALADGRIALIVDCDALAVAGLPQSTRPAVTAGSTSPTLALA